ncbi:MAG: amidohydrolase, partial [Hungatella sp.]
MNEILTQAMTLSKEMVEVRRHIHQHAEAGLDLPVTSAYVKQKLEGMGYEVQRIGTSGLTAIAGDSKKGKTILLRADMDALPMREESGLSFASAT